MKEKQFAVLSTLEIAGEQHSLDCVTPKRVVELFVERVGPVFPKTLLRTLTFEDIAEAIIAAGRTSGRRRGSKSGQRSKSKSETLNDFLKILRVEAASGSALEKAREREPVIPHLPE